MSGALHVERSGHGPAVVFWHGWGLNLRVFDALRGALGNDWRGVAVDLPGHGRSAWTADDEASRLQRLLATVPDGATLVGWSLGGQYALRAAALAPARIARLVLIGTTPRFVRSGDWPHGVDAGVLAQMRARLAGDYRGTLGDFLELQVRGSRDAPRALQALRAALLAHGEATPAALAAGLEWLGSEDLRALLPQVHQPALVIAGQYDRVTPPAASAALAAALPQGRYLELPRAAHAPFLSHPEAVLASLRGFLQATVQA